MDTAIQFSQMALKIIQAQAIVIGPLAWSEAGKVSGFHIIDQQKGELSFEGDAKEILNKLVLQYEKLFGKLSDEVCREAVADIVSQMPQEEVPSILK